MNRHAFALAAVICGAMLALSACVSRAVDDGGVDEPYLTPLDDLASRSLASGERLRVVATTPILADVVGRVGGDQIELVSLIPVGVDPHAFEPTPGDARTLAEADIVFINGFGLEAFMADLIEQAGGDAAVISASEGIAALPFEGDEHEQEIEEEGEPREHGLDPHTWLDPNNVAHWTMKIEAALSALDPARSDIYAANAQAYRGELTALDAEIRDVVAAIPAQDRKLVTDHDELGYFADEYGFTIIGTIIPGASSLAEPSAIQLAGLLDEVRALHVPAVFVSSVVNPALVETFAADAGIRVATLYLHSLTEPDGVAPSYVELMRYNAETIAAALMP
jgi:ABC-type Zn uptake system ZnuABC Zn-binding protein ZnuA